MYLKLPRFTYERSHILLFLLCILSGCAGVLSTPGGMPTSTKEEQHVSREFGHDLLGAQQPNFDYKSAARAISQGSPLGFLDWSFGTQLTAPNYLISVVHPHYVRVHLLNTVCVRNHNCGRYEAVSGLTLNSLDAAIQRRDSKLINFVALRTSEWKKLSQKYPNSKFIISPALEHNLAIASYRILADTVLSVWPEVQLDNSAESGHGEAYRGSWVEAHGTMAGNQISSTDGTEVTDLDINQYSSTTAGNIVTLRWTRSYNLRNQRHDAHGTPIWVDPRARPAGPKGTLVEVINHITDVVAAPPHPTFACTNRPFDSNSIWKPLAEDTGSGDVRANFPVLISAFPKGTISLLGANGKRVGTLGYYGAFDSKRNRFYSSYPGGSKLTGYQFQKEAVRVSGSPWVWASMGGRCAGPFLPGRRQGSFR